MAQATTVLITDMEGSTAYTQEQGDEVAMDLLRAHQKIVRQVLSDHAGREIKSMGDGFMVAFDSADGGVACALDLMAALDAHNTSTPSDPIRVRMGINTGPVIEEGGDIYGTTVNAASRIAAKALTGQVLVSEEAMKASSDGDWAFVDRGLFWLKGLNERWRLFVATRDPSSVTRLAALQGRSPFVNRESERATLRTHIDGALDGRGSIVVLAGEPGTGKSRLAEEMGMEAEGRGMQFVVGRSYEAGRGHPFAPFVEILQAVERESSPLQFRERLGEAASEIARLLPHLRRRYPDVPAPAELPADQESRYVFASVRDVLSGMARKQPLYIHLDDVHWADDQSLLFLQQLTAELATLPLLIVATYAQPELAASRPLQTALDMMQRQRVLTRVDVGPLSPADVKSLLSALGSEAPPDALVTVLHRETDGNAFFLEELIRHLHDHDRLLTAEGGWRSEIVSTDIDLPETVRLTIGRRLTTLRSDTRTVLTTAALIGQGFELELVETIADTNEEALLDALEEAERAHVIISTEEGGHVIFRYAHELIRQTLISDVSLTRRQLLHLRIADAIEKVYANALEEHASALAYHLTEAGRRADPARTVHALVAAGDRAAEAAAYSEAAKHFDRALSLIGSSDPSLRASVLEKLGICERSLGHPDDALATWSEALDVLEELGDQGSVARLCLAAGTQLAWWTRWSDTNRLISRGMAALGDRRDAYRAGLIGLQATVAGHHGDWQRAEELFDEALVLAREKHDVRVLGGVLYSKTAHHYAYVQALEAIETGLESIDYLRSSGDVWNLANAMGFVGQSLGFVGRYQEAATVTEGGVDLAKKLGNWVAFVYIDRARSWRYLALNPDFARLAADGQRDVDLGNTLGFGWMSAAGYIRMSFASFLMGDWDVAAERAEQASMREVGPLQGHFARLVLLHGYRGDRERALAAWHQLNPPTSGEPNRTGFTSGHLAAIEGLAMLGENAEVARLHDVTAEVCAREGRLFRSWDYRLHATIAGISATCARRFDEAESSLREAIRLAEGLPYVLEQPEAYRAYARMLIERDESGDADEAERYIAKAIASYERLGMPKHVELTRAMSARSA